MEQVRGARRYGAEDFGLARFASVERSGVLVRRRRAFGNVVDEHATRVRLDVEENAPIADPTPPRDGLRLETHDIAAEGVLLYLVQGPDHASSVGGGQGMNPVGHTGRTNDSTGVAVGSHGRSRVRCS